MAGTKEELKELIKQVKSLKEEADKASSLSIQSESIEKMTKALAEANKYYTDNKLAAIDTDKELKNQLKSLDKVNAGMQSMALTGKGIRNTFTDMTKESAKFARNTDEWFKKGEKLAEQYLKVSKSIGLSEGRSRTLTASFNDSVKESLTLGYTLDDLRETFGTFAEETGRARILSSEEAENIAKVAQGANLYASEATKMAEQFDLMGISSEKMVNHLNESIGSSREMGLNSNKVIKTLQSNMKAMQQYSFSSGVKGMVNMAKQAVKMRVDVSEILQMSDKFYQPEAAIEAAANLQLLGGDIAEAFGDPFQVMYEARNKPEELAKRVGKMTENMVSFNEQTGEFDMPAEARMQLQAVSKELDIGMDSLTEMTRQASKIKSIKMNVSGNILDEDMREGIAGMAKMKDGEWKVNFEGEDIGIGELDKTMAKSLLDQKEEFADKTEKDLLSDIALNTQTFSEKVENIGESQQYGFAAETDIYSVTMDAFLKDSLDTYRIESQNMMETLTNSFGKDGEGLSSVLRDAFVGTGKEGILEEQFRVIFGNMTNAIGKSMEGGVLDITKLNAEAADINIFTEGMPGFDDVKINSKGGTFVSGPKGTFSLNDEDSYCGKDGEFTAGTNLGMDSKISTSKSSAKTSSEMKIGGTATVNVNIKTDNPSLDLSQHTDVIARTVTKILSNGSQPDGDRLPQEGGANVFQSI